MVDETLNVLRKIMIDKALETGNKEAFQNLTGPYWKEYVVSTGSHRAESADPLSFLSEDAHFLDLRLQDKIPTRPYLNYRFRDTISGVLYVGEIKIPLGWSGRIVARFCPRPSTGPHLSPPDWFESLLSTAVAVLELELDK